MVNVDFWIQAEQRVIDVQSKVVIPVYWMAHHAKLQNLIPEKTLSEFLNSRRISERIVGELLMEMEMRDPIAVVESCNTLWLFYDTHQHSLIGLKRGGKKYNDILTFTHDDQSVSVMYGSMYSDHGEMGDCFGKDPSRERNENNVILQNFCRAISLSLKTLNPIYGSPEFKMFEVHRKGKQQIQYQQTASDSMPYTAKLFGMK